MPNSHVETAELSELEIEYDSPGQTFKPQGDPDNLALASLIQHGHRTEVADTPTSTNPRMQNVEPPLSN